MQDWFTIDEIDADTCIISEIIKKLTDHPVTAVATHIHWDHIGGHKYYPDF